MTREEKIRKAADDYCGCDTREQSPCFYAHIRNAFLEGAEWSDQHPQWIPVEERLPPKMGKYSKRSNDVLVVTERKELFMAKYWYDGDGWAVNGFPTSKLTHWMEIVPPRKE